mgnify:CR=1 FL=1
MRNNDQAVQEHGAADTACCGSKAADAGTNSSCCGGQGEAVGILGAAAVEEIGHAHEPGAVAGRGEVEEPTVAIAGQFLAGGIQRYPFDLGAAQVDADADGCWRGHAPLD